MPLQQNNKTSRPYKTFAQIILAAVILLVPFFHAQAAVTKKQANNTGLVGYWNFDEGKGTKAKDYSGNGITGTLTGGATWTTGKHGNALSFDGSGGFVDMGVPAATAITNNLTMAAWIKTGSNATEDFITNQWYWQNSGILFGLNNPSSNVHLAYSNGTAGEQHSIGRNLSDNKWHHLAVTFASGTFKTYIDGQLADTYTSAIVTTLGYNGSNHLNIGRDSGTGQEWWNGSIDDARIYNRVLSDAEISNLYQTGEVTVVKSSSSADNYQGLSGTYYTGMSFNTTDLTRIDPTVNFNWGSGSPDPSVPVDGFSARWTGYVKADYSETYTFYTTSDDGTRLSVNGQQIINGWVDQSPTEYSGTVALTAGKWYPITLEYYENGGGAVMTLSYSSQSTPKQIIPAAKLTYNLNHLTTTKVATNSNQNSKNTNGLVGFWPLNGPDVSGTTAYDRSGLGRNATMYGPLLTAGKVGQALHFNGTSQYASSSGFSEIGLNNQAYTFAAWVRMDPGTVKGDIIHTSSLANGTGWCLAPLKINGSNVESTSWSTADVTVHGNTTLRSNQWYYLAATWSSSAGLKVYVNGNLDGSTAQATYGASGVSNYMFLGGSPGAFGCTTDRGYFAGTIDEPRVYSRALSAAELSALYAAGK